MGSGGARRLRAVPHPGAPRAGPAKPGPRPPPRGHGAGAAQTQVTLTAGEEKRGARPDAGWAAPELRASPPMCLSSASCPNWVPRPTAGCVRPPAVPESPRPPDARGHRLGGLAAPPAASRPRPSTREDTWWASTAAQSAPRTPPRADVHAQGLWRLPAPSAPSRTPRPLSHQHPTSWDQNP